MCRVATAKHPLGISKPSGGKGISIRHLLCVGMLSLLCVGLVSADPPAQHPVTGEPLIVDCLRGTPEAIDGDLSDWNLEAMTPAVLEVEEQLHSGQTSWDGPEDLSAKFYLLWDDENVYIAVVVKDDVLSMNKAGVDIWNADCVEIFFGTTDAASGHDQHYQWGINANAQKWIWDDMDGAGGTEPAYLQIAASETDDGYICEASIPHGEITPLDWSVGNNIGFHPVVDDTDSGDREIQMTWTSREAHDQSQGYGYLFLSPNTAILPEISKNPSPADQADDVPWDAQLAWEPGVFAAAHDVYFGTSLDDVNAASVDNPLDVLRSAGQTETTFDPGQLDFGTPYFWRVDEVNAAPDHTVYKGTVWSFTSEPTGYPVADVAAIASSSHQEDKGPENTINGSGLNEEGQHSTDLTHMWLNSATELEGAHIQYDLGQAHKLHHAHVWNQNTQTETILGYGFKETLIETSLDGETWTELKTTEFPQATGKPEYTGVDVLLDDVTAQHVRFTALSNHSILGLKQVGLSEVRFYSIPVQAREPQPADDGTSDSVVITLQWRSGRGATEHEVLLSDDEQAVMDGSAVVGTVSDPSFDAGTLELGMSYFWKINSIGETNYEGALWSFLTPDQRVIDGFEDYRAKDGLHIWEYWIDGFDNPTENGAVVGNDDDAEKAIVYEGKQSMPITFNNTAAPASEATHYFDTALDLTQGNPESLKLQIHGDAPGFVDGGDTLTIGASGVDLWNTADEGRFVYKTLGGDGSITAKVESLDNVHDWAKAGVMIRESTGEDSADAYTVASAASGLTFQYRLATFGSAASDSDTRSELWANHNDKPVWVRVERIGDTFNGYISLDGATWEPSVSNPQTVVMIPSVKIGLCVTSHDNDLSTVAVFSDISTTGDVTGNWEVVEWGGGESGHPDNDAAPIYIRLADTAGKEQTFDHPNPRATVILGWDEWAIPLADFGPINPAKIDSMTIGIGGTGVEGKIFVDSIRTDRPYPASEN